MTDIPPEDRTFDRIPHYDERSKLYPIRTLVEDRPARSYTWRHIQLDQRREGACVGFACTMEAAARPRPYFGDPVLNPAIEPINQYARNVYWDAQRIDPWPGENYEGTSVTAGLKIGVQRGFWKEYRWALGPGPEAAANDVILALGYRGPVIMGTDWWTGMYRPDPDGYLHPTGNVVGGHAWLLTRYSRPKDAVWTPNSWGGDGQGWISRADLTQLLAENGEAAIPIERKWAART